MRNTEFNSFVSTGKFDEARQLLQDELASGRLLDPRSDAYWTTFADRLARVHGERSEDDVISFWQAMLTFFLNSIEPTWGQAHKGHIYFRLGVALLPRDLTRGKAELVKAYEEDRALEAAKGGTADEIRERSRQYSAYVALAILERIEEEEFPNQSDKERFIKRFLQSFDIALAGAILKPARIRQALKAIAPDQALASCESLYRELHEVTRLKLPFAMVSLTGTLLESLILADLYYRGSIAIVGHGKKAKDILKADLGDLLQEATERSVFPAESVKVAFELVRLFRNRLHPGNEIAQTYKLVPRVAWTIRVFFEHALVDWSNSFH